MQPQSIAGSESEKVRIFLLAGQSNMQGQGVVDFDHPEYYNGGKGILNNVFKKEEFKRSFPYVLSPDGGYSVRDDVFVRHHTRYGLKKGPLTIGFTGYDGNHHIGPEFQLGHRLGNYFEDPVLLIKTAWGGKSLGKDFLPPSADGKTGEYYTLMIREIREGLENMAEEFPELKDREPSIEGFIWFQGWNDMYDAAFRDHYQSNLVHLVQDIRREFQRPHLPVIIGELGNGGPKAGQNMITIRQAQKSAASALGQNTRFVETIQFARPRMQSPNIGHGHHWFGNAESYFLIGDAFGHHMIQLIENK